VLWTEAAFSVCLAWHWPDHHWQCNWRVVWTSSRMCAGKRWKLWATIVTIFSRMTRDISVFVKCNRIFRLFIFGNYHKFELLTFARQRSNILKCSGKYYMDFVVGNNLLLFQVVKEFWKSVKNWQSYRHESGVLIFGETVYVQHNEDRETLGRQS